MKTTSSESIESMAMIPGQVQSTIPIISAKTQKTCRGCGYATPENERFCPNCGLDILP
jgi:rRNA maturation endonuclease Nob1